MNTSLNNLSDFSQIGMFALACLALVVAWYEVSSSRNIARETTAKSFYNNYLELAFKHPDLARPGDTLTEKDFVGTQYEWFMAIFLLASEEILLLRDQSSTWKATLETELGYHRKYLSSEKFQSTELELYEPALKEVIKKVVAETNNVEM